MANGSLNSLTTYAGEFAGKYISAALLSALIDKGGIEVMPNIKYKSTMKKVATASGVIQNAGCDFVSNDDKVTITERVLQPEEFQVNQFCKQDFNRIGKRFRWDIQLMIKCHLNFLISLSVMLLA